MIVNKSRLLTPMFRPSANRQGYPRLNHPQPPSPRTLTLLFIPQTSIPIMSSDLQSTLEVLQKNDYGSGMVIHTSNQ